MRRLKVLVVFLSFIISFTGSVFALEINSQQVTITASEDFVSRYIWRGQDLYGQNDAAHQPSIDVTIDELFENTDVSFNIWGSFPMSGGHENGEELDYTIAFSKDLADSYNLSFGFTYFDFPNTGSTADVSEPWLSLTFNKIPLLPIDISANVFAGYDFQAKSGGPDEGWYYSFGFGTEIPLIDSLVTQEGQALSLSMINWGNDGVADLKPSFVYATDYSISTSYNLGSLSISPSINYIVNYEDQINSGDCEFLTGLGFSYAF